MSACNNKPSVEVIKELLQYDPTTGFLMWRQSKKRAGWLERDGYCRVSLKGRAVLSHRVAWALVTGAWPKGEIDHANRIKNDNRWVNLREATRSTNLQNQIAPRSDNLLGILGVSKRESGRFRARITKHGETISIGTFDNKDDAKSAYDAAKQRVHPGAVLLQ